MRRFTELTIFPWGEIRSRRTIKARDLDAQIVQCLSPVAQSPTAKGVSFRRCCPGLRMDWSRHIGGATVSFRVDGELSLFGVVIGTGTTQARCITRRADRLLIRIGHRTGREPTLPSAEILRYAPCVATIPLETARPHDLARTVSFEAALNLAAAYFTNLNYPGPANTTDEEPNIHDNL